MTRLFEAIVEANHRALAGDNSAGLHVSEYAGSFPIVALTCIDPRLNPLMPEVLGVPEEHFIWLRNAGNIITSPTSSTVRSLALACAIKGGREIAIIGHTDCRVRQTSMVELTDRFRAIGIDRSRLPDNLNEFFGLFASERQNVLRGVEFVRQSPLIGSKIPVHGLLVDIQNGKLEWLVNGYQALEMATTEPSAAIHQAGPPLTTASSLAEFKIGEMKFPEFKIGEAVPSVASPLEPKKELTPAAPASPPSHQPLRIKLDKSVVFKILGEDRKVYGPVTVKDLEQWLAEGRIDTATLAQQLGYKDWKPLAHFLGMENLPKIPIPPAIQSMLGGQKKKK